MHLVRASAIKARTAALAQLGDLLATAPAELREALNRKTLRGQATLCARLRPDLARLIEPLQAAKLAVRTVSQRILALDAEIATFDQYLTELVTTAAPSTIARLGIGIVSAAQLLVTAGQNLDRLHSEAAFAHLCGAPSTGLVGQDHAPSAEERRRSPGECLAAPHRRGAPALLRAFACLRRQADR